MLVGFTPFMSQKNDTSEIYYKIMNAKLFYPK